MSLEDNPNTNCLDGMRCPECGSCKPFDIVVGCIARTFDSGVEHTWDFDWSRESSCTCVVCGHHGQVKDFKEKEGAISNARDAQEFSPEEKVLLLHEGVGVYPPVPVTVVEKMVDKLKTCHVCGNQWYGYHDPDYWKNNPSYLVQFETGSQGIFPVRRIKKMEG